MREYGDAHHPKLLRKANKYVYGDDDEFKKTISDIMGSIYKVYAWWEVPILALELAIISIPFLASLPLIALLSVFKMLNEHIAYAIWRRYDKLRRRALCETT